jgi:hypothetical protein
LAFFCGTEHGLAALLAWFFAQLILGPAGGSNRWREMVLVSGSFGLAIAGLYRAVSGVHWLAPLRHALVDVPGEQFWYFGVPPNPHLRSFTEALQSPYLLTILGAACFLLLAVTTLVSRIERGQALTLAYLLLYGLISLVPLLGYWSDAYMHPLARVLFLCFGWLVMQGVPIFLQSRTVRSIWQQRLATPVCLGVLLLPTALPPVWGQVHLPVLTQKLEALVRHRPAQDWKDLGTFLSPAWKAHLEMIARHVQSPMQLVAWDLTDDNWVNGIRRIRAGFFLPNTDRIHPGDRVAFAGSGARRVVEVEDAGTWTNVFVDGNLLDPDGDGYPQPIIHHRWAKLEGEGKVPLWSTYAGLPEAKLDIFHPDTDYIIHSLGAESRERYLQRFRQTRPQWVRTDPTYRWGYGEWLLNANWPFYQLVLQHYEMLEGDGIGILWRKRSDDWQMPPAEWEQRINVPAGTEKVVIPRSDGVILVNLHYRLVNPWRQVPFVGKLPRYLVHFRQARSLTPVSLPPDGDQVSFPVRTTAGLQPQLAWEVSSLLPGVRLEVEEVRFRRLELSAANEKFFAD